MKCYLCYGRRYTYSAARFGPTLGPGSQVIYWENWKDWSHKAPRYVKATIKSCSWFGSFSGKDPNPANNGWFEVEVEVGEGRTDQKAPPHRLFHVCKRCLGEGEITPDELELRILEQGDTLTLGSEDPTRAYWDESSGRYHTFSLRASSGTYIRDHKDGSEWVINKVEVDALGRVSFSVKAPPKADPRECECCGNDKTLQSCPMCMDETEVVDFDALPFKANPYVGG